MSESDLPGPGTTVFHNGVRVDPEQTEKVIRWALDMFEASRSESFTKPPGEASGVRT